ncbi:MAG: Hemolysin-type calcium-binding region [Nocardioides sp.]|nr:Hemolysin-type calcium-binding region [Nocardioides sp.]
MLLGLPLTALGPAYADVATCQGEPATVVGQPGQDVLRGTAGRDVVVTGGAAFVDAGDGDDLVCDTGSGTTAPTYVRGGFGDDDVHGWAAGTRVELGPGSDLFVGGDGPDTVSTDNAFQEGPELDALDVVRSGGGDDLVESGHPGQLLVDDLDLGAGDDQLAPYARVAGEGSRLVGGPGSDELYLGAGAYGLDDPLSSSAWLFRNDGLDGSAWAQDRMVLGWTGFEEFDLSAPFGRLGFVGGPADEVLTLPRSAHSVEMGAGDDAYSSSRSRLPTVLDGGPGTDVLRPGFCHGALAVDVGARRYRCRNEQVDQRARPQGFDVLVLEAREAVVRGTPRTDRLSLAACRGAVSGLGGADVLSVLEVRSYVPRYACGPRSAPVRLLGGPGDDRLRGGPVPDVLLGGTGRDRADGARGRDTCDAEVERRCEG